MGETTKASTGTIGWADLTVPDAERLRDFYGTVVGWKTEPVEMGGYQDYTMTTADGTPVAGVCHARGVNADIPPSWMLYVNVDDLDQSLEHCRRLGGRVIVEPRTMGSQGRYAMIEDPAEAVIGLFEPA